MIPGIVVLTVLHDMYYEGGIAVIQAVPLFFFGGWGRLG